MLGVVLAVFVASVQIVLADIGSPYTLVNRVQTDCEMESITIGSTLSSHFNSLDEESTMDERIQNEFLVEHLAFNPSPHVTTSHTLLHRTEPHHKRIHSMLWAMENKWIYLLGDSTMKTLWTAMLSPAQNDQLANPAPSNCTQQLHAEDSTTPDFITETVESVKTTCESSGYGSKGRITFDWKMLPIEKRDEWLFGDNGVWSTGNDVVPDFLAVQVGSYACLHAYNSTLKTINNEVLQKYHDSLPALMTMLRSVVDRSSSRASATTVVFITGSRSASSDSLLDRCSWRFNRLAVHEAHKKGIAVMEREEIERRLMYKAEKLPEMSGIKMNLHLAPPAPQIVATALIGLLTCLHRNESSAMPGLDAFHLFKKKVGRRRR